MRPLLTQVTQLASLFKTATDEYLYHVSYYRNLDSIASSGLMPAGNNTLSPGYASHAKGRVFMTESDGVSFWFHRCEQFAEANSDDIYDEGWVPIVLRIPYEGELNDDDLGTQDARANAYYVNEAVEPDEIEAWNGSSWISIGDAGSIDTLQAFDVQTETDDEEDGGEERTLYYFKNSNPLLPSL